MHCAAKSSNTCLCTNSKLRKNKMWYNSKLFRKHNIVHAYTVFHVFYNHQKSPDATSILVNHSLHYQYYIRDHWSPASQLRIVRYRCSEESWQTTERWKTSIESEIPHKNLETKCIHDRNFKNSNTFNSTSSFFVSFQHIKNISLLHSNSFCLYRMPLKHF